MSAKIAKFAFVLGHRVFIPWKDAVVQGIVSARIEIANHENEYHVHYLLSDLGLAHVVCSESALLAAQPRKNSKGK